MQIGQVVLVHGIKAKIGELTLTQDEKLRIIDIGNFSITFERLSDGSVHEVSRMALEFIVE